MNCTDIQNQLLTADDLNRLADSALAEHVRNCPQCAEMLRQLSSIEAAIHDLPAPPEAEDAKKRFLAKMNLDASAPLATQSTPATRRCFAWTGGRHLARAAILLLVAGLVIWLTCIQNSATARADRYLERLIEWNIKLANTQQSAERIKLHDLQLKIFQQELKNISLTDHQKKIAESLLVSAGQLAHSDLALTRSNLLMRLGDQLAQDALIEKDSGQAATMDILAKGSRQIITEGAIPNYILSETELLNQEQQQQRRQLHEQIRSRIENDNHPSQNELKGVPNTRPGTSPGGIQSATPSTGDGYASAPNRPAKNTTEANDAPSRQLPGDGIKVNPRAESFTINAINGQRITNNAGQWSSMLLADVTGQAATHAGDSGIISGIAGNDMTYSFRNGALINAGGFAVSSTMNIRNATRDMIQFSNRSFGDAAIQLYADNQIDGCDPIDIAYAQSHGRAAAWAATGNNTDADNINTLILAQSPNKLSDVQLTLAEMLKIKQTAPAAPEPTSDETKADAIAAQAYTLPLIQRLLAATAANTPESTATQTIPQPDPVPVVLAADLSATYPLTTPDFVFLPMITAVPEPSSLLLMLLSAGLLMTRRTRSATGDHS